MDYWIVCLGNEQRSFCLFWGCIQAFHWILFTYSNRYTLVYHYFINLYSQLTYDVEHLFICLFVICISSSVRCLKNLWPFFHQIILVSYCWILKLLHVYRGSLVSYVSFASLYLSSHSPDIISSDYMFLNLMKLNLSITSFR